MTIIYDPVEMLQKEIKTWDSPFVELDCFGTDSAERIANTMEEFCRAHLGSKLRGYLFYGASVGSTHGVQLEDGRDIVIKVRPPAETNPYLSFDRNTLESICRVMKWLTDTGYPCPKPILGPSPVGKGVATVEEFLDRGQRGNGFDPECRSVIASGLAHLIELLQSFDGEVLSLKHFQRSESLYPQPHSKLFDFERTAEGAEWIDTLARRARQGEAMRVTSCSGTGIGELSTCGFSMGRSLPPMTGTLWRSVPRLSWWVSLLTVSRQIGHWKEFGEFRPRMTSTPTSRTTSEPVGSRSPRANENLCLPIAFTALLTGRAVHTLLSLIK